MKSDEAIKRIVMIEGREVIVKNQAIANQQVKRNRKRIANSEAAVRTLTQINPAKVRKDRARETGTPSNPAKNRRVATTIPIKPTRAANHRGVIKGQMMKDPMRGVSVAMRKNRASGKTIRKRILKAVLTALEVIRRKPNWEVADKKMVAVVMPNPRIQKTAPAATAGM